MRQLVRQHLRFFLFATLAAFGLRLLFLLRFPGITTDSFVYGDIAKNWLQHGIYGLSGPDEISATYIRLPGYPAFLAAIFAIFGMEHYRAVLVVQMFVDIGTCLVIADMARRLISPQSGAKLRFCWRRLPIPGELCGRGSDRDAGNFLHRAGSGFCDRRADDRQRTCAPGWAAALRSRGAILLRPDGGLLLMAIEFYLLVLLVLGLERQNAGESPATTRASCSHIFRAGLILGVVSLAPLVPWGWRNLHTLHRFQPLAPRYANEEDEFVPAGFNRWVKTWIADYASVEEIYWPVPGETVDADKLPARAFDSEAQKQQTVELLTDYNNTFTSLRSWINGLPPWPANASEPRRCVTTCGCHWSASPTCGCVLVPRLCLPTPGGGNSMTTRMVSAGGRARDRRPGLRGSGGRRVWQGTGISRIWHCRLCL